VPRLLLRARAYRPLNMLVHGSLERGTSRIPTRAASSIASCSATSGPGDPIIPCTPWEAILPCPLPPPFTRRIPPASHASRISRIRTSDRARARARHSGPARFAGNTRYTGSPALRRIKRGGPRRFVPARTAPRQVVSENSKTMLTAATRNDVTERRLPRGVE